MCELGVSGSGVGESGSVGRVSSRAGPPRTAGPLGGLSKNDSLKTILSKKGQLERTAVPESCMRLGSVVEAAQAAGRAARNGRMGA